MSDAGSANKKGTPILVARGLRKRLGSVEILRSIDLEIWPGTLSVLSGRNGAGKTTLLDILTGYMAPDAGTLTVAGRRLTFAAGGSPRGFRAGALARAGVVRTWQDSRLFETRSLIENIAVATPNQLGEQAFASVLKPRAVRRERRRIELFCAERLADVGLAGREASSADRVSLGQARRVAILRAVQTGARLILMDEPLAGLDARGKADVLRLIERLRRKERIAFVVVEHISNTDVILPLRPQRLVLEDGRLTVGKPADGGISVSGKELASALSSGRVEQHALPRGGRLWVAGSAVQGKPLLVVRNLALRRGTRDVFDPGTGVITFTLHAGEVGVLEAPNGWGKTTLCDAIAGVAPIRSGEVSLGGVDRTRSPTFVRVRCGLRYARATTEQFGSLSVGECLALSGVERRREKWRPFLRRRVATLSGGERRRLTLACTAFGAPVVELYDEPFSALDRAAMTHTMDQLRVHASLTRLIALPIQAEGTTCC